MRPTHEAGYTLIDLVIFTVILSIMAATLFTGYHELLKQPTRTSELIIGQQLAQKRMEYLISLARKNGISSLVDPCVSNPSAPICLTNLSTYTYATTQFQSTSRGRLVIVGVNTPSQYVSLQQELGSYE